MRSSNPAKAVPGQWNPHTELSVPLLLNLPRNGPEAPATSLLISNAKPLNKPRKSIRSKPRKGPQLQNDWGSLSGRGTPFRITALNKSLIFPHPSTPKCSIAQIRSCIQGDDPWFSSPGLRAGDLIRPGASGLLCRFEPRNDIQLMCP